MKTQTIKRRCLFPSCPEKTTARGLCHNHYVMAHDLVHDGRTTWEKLIRTKKALAPKRPAIAHFLED